MASELELLREQREAEDRRLQRCREKRGRLEEKLKVCSDAVARTVHSLDLIHEIEDRQASAELQSAQAGDLGTALNRAKSDALAAGRDAERALHSISGTGGDRGEEGEEASDAVREDADEPDGEWEKENDPPAGAFRKGLGDEWDGVKACGTRVLVALPEDVPVEDFDEDLRAPLQQIQLR